MKYAFNIASAHDFLILTETRETKERLQFLLGKLHNGMQYKSSAISQFEGGVGILIKETFLRKFRSVRWTVIEQGRMARLELDGPAGSLHIYAVYLHPSNKVSQAASIRKLSSVLKSDIHNIVSGDFNFVMQAYDRISKTDAECTGSRELDCSSSKVWQNALNGIPLNDFEQNRFTYEGSWGWSKLDRAYTNTHPAILATKHTACNTLSHPRHLSDHNPLSFTIKNLSQPTSSSKVPAWIASHAEYTHEVEAEFAELTHTGDLTPFQRLLALNTAIRTTSKYIRRKCKDAVAETTAHRLSASLSFIRAMECGNLVQARGLQKAYAKLSKVDVDGAWRQSSSYKDVLDHTVELLNTSVQQRIAELKKIQKELPEAVFEQRKHSILNAFKRLAPGTSSEIAAIRGDDGNICTDSGSIAAALCAHWQAVFEVQTTNDTLRTEWLRQVSRMFEGSLESLRPTMEDIEAVMKHLPSSSCGIDDIPFEAYGGIRQLTSKILKEVVDAMFDGTDAAPRDFNWAILVCIGKESSETLDTGEAVYTADSTRPISIVDASNRLIASIFREALERCVTHKISEMQRGFLKGRPMLRNIIEIDWAAQKVSLLGPRGAIILLDFKAAFPSLDHTYMWQALSALGFPNEFIRVLRTFYTENHHFIKVAGRLHKGPTMRAGVRQGCPLSGILFVICVDVLLRKLGGDSVCTRDAPRICRRHSYCNKRLRSIGWHYNTNIRRIR